MRGCCVPRSQRRTSCNEWHRLCGWWRILTKALGSLAPTGISFLAACAWRVEILRWGAPEQLLHGEPHSDNVLNAHDGPRFIDFETCCRGPVEFDVAHVPDEVSAYYPALNGPLLQMCRRLVLAMVAAWRWDVRDEFPDGIRHGQEILTILREGPPWPALGPLAAD